MEDSFFENPKYYLSYDCYIIYIIFCCVSPVMKSG